MIGVTSYLEQAQTGVWDVRASFLPEVYLKAVTDAGGIALVLPPQPVDDEVASRIIASLDGLIVSGGADVDPRRYGQDAHERTGAPREDRDAFEDALLRAAIDAGLPFLGICRGAQMLNVALGGTLIQHLPDEVGDERYQLGAGRFNPIDVEVEAGSRIAAVLGEDRRAIAPLYHHQAIGEVADGLTVTSRTADGVIESLELEAVPFGIAVQWHPEEHAEDRRLFAGLVQAAKDHRSTRAADAARRAEHAQHVEGNAA
ncbi:MAG: gamma-glutamyl-gamma-aminobutyrate hydrolase family protein [Actinobacteria bacterium]|nr:gamma-glutamyl-gamma-aminobutyrate hydrolase family protein [Actinomycetota bacterium]